MQKIIPHLWFDDAAEEAAALYAGLIAGSRLDRITRYGKAGFARQGRPERTVTTVEFELAGHRMVGRVTEASMGMGKLDVAALEAAA